MTAQQALSLLKKELSEPFSISQCREYQNFFCFFLAPPGNGQNEYFTGVAFVVNKRTKAVSVEELLGNRTIHRTPWHEVKL